MTLDDQIHSLLAEGYLVADWLHRLRYHPLFRNPEQEIQGDQELLRITIEAREACQSRFWNGQ